MKPYFRKRFALALTAVAICVALTGCNKDGKDPDASPADPNAPVSVEDDVGVNPPDNLGNPDDDIDFGLQGPGDTHFDDVDYNGSQPGVSGVGDTTDDNQFVYTPPEDTTGDTSGDTTDDPGLNLVNNDDGEDGEANGDEGDGEGDAISETSTPGDFAPVEPTVPEEQVPPQEEIPSEIALPNTGMFLEDD